MDSVGLLVSRTNAFECWRGILRYISWDSRSFRCLVNKTSGGNRPLSKAFTFGHRHAKVFSFFFLIKFDPQTLVTAVKRNFKIYFSSWGLFGRVSSDGQSWCSGLRNTFTLQHFDFFANRWSWSWNKLSQSLLTLLTHPQVSIPLLIWKKHYQT